MYLPLLNESHSITSISLSSYLVPGFPVLQPSLVLMFSFRCSSYPTLGGDEDSVHPSFFTRTRFYSLQRFTCRLLCSIKSGLSEFKNNFFLPFYKRLSLILSSKLLLTFLSLPGFSGYLLYWFQDQFIFVTSSRL